MKLTEGQLFTIEALNRIDGFAWPKHASHAFMNEDERFVSFTSGRRPNVVVVVERRMYVGIYAGSASAGCKHPDWRNSLVTREQFDSVDGWVRSWVTSVPEKIPSNGIEVECGAFGRKWRYRNPTKEAEMQPEAPKQPSIDELYSQYKTQRGIVESAKKALADEMEAEDKLIEQIKAWNLEHGFDVRLLDESEEKPELVITDWRDLRIGDIVEVIKVSKMSEIRRYKEMIGRHLPVVHTEPPGVEGQPVQVDCDGKLIFISRWKFIRRPSK